MDAYRQRLYDLIAARGDLKAASLAVGRNHAYFHQFFHAGKPRVLPEETRRSLAVYLRLNEADLRPEPGNLSDNLVTDRFTLVKVAMPLSGERDLPVIGEIVAGTSGEFVLNGSVNEYVGRPEQLRTVSNGFALYIVGDSMEPIAFNGQIAYVNPNKPVVPGRLVVCELRDGTAMIKLLYKRMSDRIILAQMNPPSEFEVMLPAVLHLFKIIGIADAS